MKACNGETIHAQSSASEDSTRTRIVSYLVHVEPDILIITVLDQVLICSCTRFKSEIIEDQLSAKCLTFHL